MKGIDISEFQPNVDYRKLKEGGIDFAIIRCGYGKNQYQKDNCFEKHYKGCKEAGIKVGTYLYSYASTIDGAYLEAHNCLEFIKGKTFDLPVFYDVEDSDTTGTASSRTITSMCDIFCKQVQEAGFKAGVYANLYWFNEKIYVEELQKYYIWLAQWNSTMDATFKVDIWQYSNSGTVAGINGRVDMNESFIKDFPKDDDIPPEKPIRSYSYENDSKARTVYSDLWLTKPIGSLNPYEKCSSLGIFGGKAIVMYEIDGTDHNWKIGFTDYVGGVK